MKICIGCGKEKKSNSGERCGSCASVINGHKGKGRKKPESFKTWASNFFKGRKLSEEHRKKLSESHSGKNLSEYHSSRIKEGQKSSPNKYKMAHWKGKRNPTSKENIIRTRQLGKFETSIEKAVKNCLIEIGIRFEKEKRFEGIGCVDFFLNEFSIAIECDGEYWHNRPGDKEKDANKDSKLQEKGIKVIRFTEKRIKKDLQSVKEEILDSTRRKLCNQKMEHTVVPGGVMNSWIAVCQ